MEPELSCADAGTGPNGTVLPFAVTGMKANIFVKKLDKFFVCTTFVPFYCLVLSQLPEPMMTCCKLAPRNKLIT